jgi:tripartite tricarboxylate transporter family receptor
MTAKKVAHSERTTIQWAIRIKRLTAHSCARRHKAEETGMRALFRAAGDTLAVALTFMAAPLVAAETYPDRPITVVVPFTPGASTDAVARLAQDTLARELSQPIVIENRPGAGGTQGSAVVANAQPDGYTLLVVVNSPLTTNMFVQKTYPFNPRTAFAPISLAAESTLVLAVNAKLPVTTVRELVDYVKRNPGKVSYGSAGVGSSHQIAGEMILGRLPGSGRDVARDHRQAQRRDESGAQATGRHREVQAAGTCGRREQPGGSAEAHCGGVRAQRESPAGARHPGEVNTASSRW